MLVKTSKRITAVSLALAAGMAIAAAAEKPIVPEHNPPGDIPDTQVFVTYASPLGFNTKVPEGWSRADEAQSVRISDKYDTIEIVVSPLNSAPTVDSVNTNQAPELAKTGRAVKVVKVKQVRLKGGSAVLISYTSNSEPNPVTNKQIRLEHDRYLFYKDGKLATLDMAAPQGADNVDDWSTRLRTGHCPKLHAGRGDCRGAQACDDHNSPQGARRRDGFVRKRQIDTAPLCGRYRYSDQRRHFLARSWRA